MHFLCADSEENDRAEIRVLLSIKLFDSEHLVVTGGEGSAAADVSLECLGLSHQRVGAEQASARATEQSVVVRNAGIVRDLLAYILCNRWQKARSTAESIYGDASFSLRFNSFHDS